MEFCTEDIERAMDYAVQMSGLKELKTEQRRAISDLVSARQRCFCVATSWLQLHRQPSSSALLSFPPVVHDRPCKKSPFMT